MVLVCSRRLRPLLRPSVTSLVETLERPDGAATDELFDCELAWRLMGSE